YLPLNIADEIERRTRRTASFLVEIKIPSREIIKISDQDLRLMEWNPRNKILACDVGRVDSFRGEVVRRAYFKKNRDVWFELPAFQSPKETRPKITLEEDLNTPPQIFAIDPTNNRKILLLDLNPNFKELSFAPVEEVTW